MRKRDKNIFKGVIDYHEDVMTEFLTNLMSFPPIRKIFLELLQNALCKSLDNVTFEDFHTQVTLNNGSRIDIAIRNDNVEILIEVKKSIFRELTDNQPIEYLNHLKNHNSKEIKALFFLVPKGYFYLSEIKEEWHKSNSGIDFIERKNESPGSIIYWEDILKELKRLNLQNMSIIFKYYIELLEDILTVVYLSENEIRLLNEVKSVNMSNIESKEKIKFGIIKEDIAMINNTSVPLLVYKLGKIVDNVKENLESELKEKKLTIKRYFDYSQNWLDIKLNNTILIMFGLWLPYWHIKGNPYCIGIKNVEESREIKEIFESYWNEIEILEEKPSSFRASEYIDGEDNTEYYLSPIKLKILESEKGTYEIIKGLKRLIEKIVSEVIR